MRKEIAQFADGDIVDGAYMVKDCRLVEFRNKPGRYLNLVVADRTGQMEARMWDDGEKYLTLCQENKVICLKAEVTSFKGVQQLKLIGLRKPRDGEYADEDFIAVAPRSIDEMRQELESIIDNMSEGPEKLAARALTGSVYYERFCRAPAAKQNHHNYMGGLLDHTLGVMNLCLKISEAYPEINRELLLTGALFHDVGKIEEMEMEPLVEYTDDGKLLGHIILGIQIASDLLAQVGIDHETASQILHMITSHHGEYEFQSPKRPKFIEARILHLADQIDADVFKFRAISETVTSGKWTAFSRSIGNAVYTGVRRRLK